MRMVDALKTAMEKYGDHWITKTLICGLVAFLVWAASAFAQQVGDKRWVTKEENTREMFQIEKSLERMEKKIDGVAADGKETRQDIKDLMRRPTRGYRPPPGDE